MHATMALNWMLMAGLFLLALAGPEKQLVAQSPQEQAMLQEDMPEEALLAECPVDEDGFLGTEWAMAISLEDNENRQRALRTLQSLLEAQGLLNINVEGDGSCQFHAICLAGGLPIGAQELREQAVQHLKSNADRFRPFVHEVDWDAYLQSMLDASVWGDHLTLSLKIEKVLSFPSRL